MWDVRDSISVHWRHVQVLLREKYARRSVLVHFRWFPSANCSRNRRDGIENASSRRPRVANVAHLELIDQFPVQYSQQANSLIDRVSLHTALILRTRWNYQVAKKIVPTEVILIRVKLMLTFRGIYSDFHLQESFSSIHSSSSEFVFRSTHTVHREESFQLAASSGVHPLVRSSNRRKHVWWTLSDWFHLIMTTEEQARQATTQSSTFEQVKTKAHSMAIHRDWFFSICITCRNARPKWWCSVTLLNKFEC